jgi:hypothetical protein
MVQVKSYLQVAFKVSLARDALSMRKCDNGFIKKIVSIANQLSINHSSLIFNPRDEGGNERELKQQCTRPAANKQSPAFTAPSGTEAQTAKACAAATNHTGAQTVQWQADMLILEAGSRKHPG